MKNSQLKIQRLLSEEMLGDLRNKADRHIQAIYDVPKVLECHWGKAERLIDCELLGQMDEGTHRSLV